MPNKESPLKPMRQFPADSRAMAAELKPILQKLEKGRGNSLAKIRRGWIRIGIGAVSTLAAIIIFSFIWSLLEDYNAGYSLLILIFIIAGTIFCLVTHGSYIKGHHQAYRRAYKKELIGGMTKLLHTDMNYLPERGISQATFKQAGLYTTGIDRYRCEDLFTGKIGKTEMMFSEVHAEDKKKRHDGKGHSTTYWVTIFKGLFLIADFNKNFRGWLTVKPDFAESSFGWFGRKIQNFHPHLIRLESPDFEKAFVVHGSDQVEARYILTPDMQERLLALRSRYGKDLRLSLKNSQLYLTIPKSEDLFEPNMYTPAHELSQMQSFINQMTWVFKIIETLDLNTRIWSKQD